MKLQEKSLHQSGNDAEQRREAFAMAYGLSPDTSWGWILKEMRKTEPDLLSKNGIEESENRRMEMALRYGKGPDATWDQLYELWEGRWKPLEITLPSVVATLIIVTVGFSFSTHWIAILVVFGLLATTWGALLLQKFASYAALDQHYWAFVAYNPEIKARAEASGIIMQLTN